jgi:ABC-type branched-subunit amino acid transport system ATPase component
VTAAWQYDPILTIEHLTMRFGGLTAVDDVSFAAGRGDITAVIGPNGAGKTTLFNCLTGFYKPTTGQVTMRQPGGAEFLLERLPDYRIAREARVTRTFQNIRLFSGMTVLENLMVAQHNPLLKASWYTVGGVFGIGPYAGVEKDAIDKAKHWLELTDLLERADDPAGDLAYGQQRRLEIARAMCTDPLLLCLDEPAAGMNAREGQDLNTLLRRIRDEHGVSLLLIEHDMGVVMDISDRIVVLDYGKKIADGDVEHVKNDPHVIAAYLGVEEDEVDRALGEAKEDLGYTVPAHMATADTPGAPAAAVAPPAGPMLGIEDVETFYGKIQALRGVNMTVYHGEIVSLIGANGAGKSTLMMTICGSPRARAGRITFDGIDITGAPTHSIMHAGIAQSPEGRRVFPRMTVAENLLMGAAVNNFVHVDVDLARMLERRQGQRAGTLSGGEQQMLAIARALMCRPRLLLLDEPSLGLAPLIVKQIFDTIAELNRSEGLTVFLVEQNAYHALKLAHRGYVMVNGEITMQGTGAELLAREDMRAAYLEGGRH